MHHVLRTHTKGAYPAIKHVLSGYPVTRGEFWVCRKDKKGIGKREDAGGATKEHVMTYLPLAESPQRETGPWFS